MPSPEDIEVQLDRLQIYRRTLAHFLRQKAELGNAQIPPSIASGILDARENIRQIKNTLRSWNIVLEDHPDDGTKIGQVDDNEKIFHSDGEPHKAPAYNQRPITILLKTRTFVVFTSVGLLLFILGFVLSRYTANIEANQQITALSTENQKYSTVIVLQEQQIKELQSTSNPVSVSTARANEKISYSFLENAPNARWFNGTGSIPFGGSQDTRDGGGFYNKNITLEDGQTYEQALFTHPNWHISGFIRGDFDITEIQSGQHFMAGIGFAHIPENKHTNGVKVKITFRDQVIWEGVKVYDGVIIKIDIDLSQFANQGGTFSIEAQANGDFANDLLNWIDPKIAYI